MTGNYKISQIKQFWKTTRSRKAACWNEDQKVKTVQSKLAKNNDEVQMWRSWLWKGIAKVSRRKWKLENGDLNGTVSKKEFVYMVDRVTLSNK